MRILVPLPWPGLDPCLPKYMERGGFPGRAMPTLFAERFIARLG